jgi:predicted DNA binding CopG/RHH family protein
MPYDKPYPLDDEEREILKAYQAGTLTSVPPSGDHQSMASETLKKNRKINIRISENDLAALQRKALREGIPCQTLIGSILHKYASGFLHEVN